MNNVRDIGGDVIRVILVVSGRNKGRLERGMCMVSNVALRLVERVIGGTCMDVELALSLINGDDGGEIGENNFFERDEETEESLNDERRLSLRGLEDDIP